MLVEVGCGTGEAMLPLIDRCRYQVGIDFNKSFIDFCNDNVDEKNANKCNFVEGDAAKMEQLMIDKVDPVWMKESTKVRSARCENALCC